MKFDNLAELAKAVSMDVLRDEFLTNKKYPINKELMIDIDKLPNDECGDMAREDPEEFTRLLNNSVTIRLNYLYEEGFLDKKKGYYRMYTEAEIKKHIDQVGDID
jgi:hypothetical protein